MENKTIFRKDDLVDMLSEKTGFFKKHMVEVVDALDEIIFECLKKATLDKGVELNIATGIAICGKKKPASAAKDPRTGEDIISPEKIIPSAVFKQSIRNRLFTKPKGYKKKKK